jgi:hypothetical protein
VNAEEELVEAAEWEMLNLQRAQPALDVLPYLHL